jgi:hypothetical protein
MLPSAAALEAGAAGIEDILRQALRFLGRTVYASRWKRVDFVAGSPAPAR